MALFEKLGELVKNVGDKTNDMIEITRLNARISGQKSMIADVQKKIGVLCWEKFEAGEEVGSEIAELCAVIHGAYEQIDSLKAEIASIKEAEEPVIVEYTCPACGAENTPGDDVCKGCGAKLEEADASVCSDCGGENVPEAKFCKDCGARL